MNNSNWRIPNEEERKQALYWIKRNSNGNISFPMYCFMILLVGVVSFDVALYIFKSMGRYSDMNVVEASYHSGFGAKPTTFSVSRAIKKKTKTGDMGYVIKFPKGNSWTGKSFVFIPREQ